MQNSLLPVGICDEIEKIQRRFIWGETGNTKHAHLVAWAQICKPKEAGGLGIRRLRQTNEAFPHKIAWQLISEPDNLWVKVLRAKYLRGHDWRRTVKSQPYDSHLWLNLCKIWPAFLSGLKWEPGNGSNIFFWTDNWVGLDQPLIQYTTCQISSSDMHTLLSSFATESGRGWDVNRLLSLFDEQIFHRIQAILPPGDFEDNDRLIWRKDTFNHSIVKSAYLNIMGENMVQGNIDWKGLWKWKGPQRIKTFIWLLLHNRLPTKGWSHTWGGSDGRCSICDVEIETTLHLFRDCPFATNIWSIMVPTQWRQQFFIEEEDKWVASNIEHGMVECGSFKWVDFFFVACWHLWFWRNKIVHDEEFRLPRNPLQIIHGYMRTIYEAYQSFNRDDLIKTSIPINIKWEPPDVGWVKLNTDGAAKGCPGKGGCGGLIRDPQGVWHTGFTFFIGRCTAIEAELWGILTGLEVAWSKSFKKIIVESDSAAVISLLTSSGNAARESNLMTRIRAWIRQDWDIHFQHTFREGNFCADWLANLAVDTGEELQVFDHAPPGITLLLFKDSCGISSSRTVRV